MLYKSIIMSSENRILKIRVQYDLYNNIDFSNEKYEINKIRLFHVT